jgi:hypothetical protein
MESAGTPIAADPAEGSPHPHDFEVQKRIHRAIRNDPDYDDWDYGTEPLPHEAWRSAEPREPGAESHGTGRP